MVKKNGRVERAASAGARTAGRGVGAAVGTALSSPFGLGALGVGAVLVGLFIFRKQISEALSGLGAGLGEGLGGINIQLPEIKFPEFNFPDITFPSFEFPSFEFPSFEFPSFDFLGLGGNGEPKPKGTLPFPPDVEDIGLIEDPAKTCPCGSNIVQDIQGDVSQVCIPCPEAPMEGDPAFIGPTQPFTLEGFLGLADQPSIIPEQKTTEQVQSEIPDQQFFGGGPSFEGGVVTETPIEFLSLSQIIDKFMVTASQAANLKAIAQGFTPEEQAFLDQGPIDVGGFTSGGPPAVSDPQFQGLSPEEIFKQLVGGTISNF